MTETGFQRPKYLECDYETLTRTYGRFTAQPFERGFAVTVGNALRRILLSSIKGAAITAVRIEGVLHEFSTIPGVVDDVTDIILNLKSIPLKLNGNQSKTMTLKKEGPATAKALRAKAAELPPEVLKPAPLVTGHDLLALGFAQGPLLGQVLRELEELQLEERLQSQEEALAYARAQFARRGG